MKNVFLSINSTKTLCWFSIFKIIPIADPTPSILAIGYSSFSVFIKIIILTVKNSILFPKNSTIFVKTIGYLAYFLKSFRISCFRIVIAKFAVIIIPTYVMGFAIFIYINIFVFKFFVFDQLACLFIKIPTDFACVCKTLGKGAVFFSVIDIFPCVYIFFWFLRDFLVFFFVFKNKIF